MRVFCIHALIGAFGKMLEPNQENQHPTELNELNGVGERLRRSSDPSTGIEDQRKRNSFPTRRIHEHR